MAQASEFSVNQRRAELPNVAVRLETKSPAGLGGSDSTSLSMEGALKGIGISMIS